MPPQPVRSVRRNATVLISHEALLRHPKLATSMAYAIAVWSRIDAELGTILAYMLKGDTQAAVAMYAALTSSQAKMDALEAAARVSLVGDDRRLFAAVLILVKRAGAKRNRVAHWLWGECPQIPNALILIDPDAVLDFHTDVKEFMQALSEDKLGVPRPKVDIARAFVYRSADFAEIISEFINIYSMSVKLSTAFAETHRETALASVLRNQLLALPQIQAELQRIP
jgi:hypothetical protein